MIQIAQEYRTSKKERTCGLCGGKIHVGDRYSHQLNKEGSECWAFDAHCECQFICFELWEYIDPWDGVYEDDFIDGCHEFCHHMICPNCTSYIAEDNECLEDESYCENKIIETLLKYDFCRVKSDDPKAIGKRVWGLIPKEKPLDLVPGLFK